MQKSAYFAILGVSLVMTAVSLGFAASRIISIRFYAPPPASTVADSHPVNVNRPAVPPEKWTNLFAPSAGMEIPSKYEKAVASSVVPVSNTRYVLLGTISSNSSAARRAILWADGMTHPLLARENMEIEPGLRIVAVERSYVRLKRGAAEEILEIQPVGSKTTGGGKGPSRAVSRTPRVRRTPAPKVSLQVNKIGENAYSMDEATVSQLTENINQFMTQVRIIPYFEGNKSAGYRIAAIRPGSAFAQLGFQGGDVIQRVNTVELTSPEKMYTIFQNLKDEKHVTVDVLRRGQKNTLTYEIQ